MRARKTPRFLLVCIGVVASLQLGAACRRTQSAPVVGHARPLETTTTGAIPEDAALLAERQLASTTPRAQAPATLTLASWNLRWLAAADGNGPIPRSAAAYARLAGYATRLDADVIAVQEVESADALARVFDPARYSFYVTQDPSPQRTGFVYDKRLSVHVHPDYTALATGSLRSGADLALLFDGKWVRLLSVHLKSGCFSQPLSDGQPCAKLASQVPQLEAWIDARAAEATPFAVLGDFNRRLFAAADPTKVSPEVKRSRGAASARDGWGHDPVWTALDDATPPEADLFAPTETARAKCWDGQPAHFIDHIVLSRSLSGRVVPQSFVQRRYDAAHQRYRKQLSDHCPIALRLSAIQAPRPDEASGETNPDVARDHAGTTVGAATAADVSLDVASTRAPNTRSIVPLPIKGNHGRKGSRYYHTPACPQYERVKIDTAKGEQLFADEAAARAAGYERSPDCD